MSFFFGGSMPPLFCHRLLFLAFSLSLSLSLSLQYRTFSRSLATSFLARPGRAAASCSASAAAKPSSSSEALFAPAIGDDTADEEDCLLEEEAVGGALILSCETSELSIRMCVEGDRGERDKRER